MSSCLKNRKCLFFIFSASLVAPFKMQLLSLIIILLIQNITATPQENLSKIKDIYLGTSQLVVKYRYPIETHYVTTPDGYILTIHRIPHGKNHTISRKPLLLMHGLFCSSGIFVSSAERSLAFALADAGYDVWLGNNRGNQESRNHTVLNPNKNPKFWNFSLHELGVIDIPAMVDHVLNFTGQYQLYYVGFSQGTTVFYIMATMRPEYNKKIKVHLDLAPSAHMQHSRVPYIDVFLTTMDLFEEALKVFKIYEFLPYSKFRLNLLYQTCQDDPEFVSNLLLFVFGHTSQLNITFLPMMVGQFPVGASTKQMFHFGQMIKSEYFRQFDYKKNNFKMYGSSTPPLYNLSLISSPGFLFYSTTDNFIVNEDVEITCQEMGAACVGKYLFSGDDAFNHVDYLYGTKAPSLYSKMITVLDKF